MPISDELKRVYASAPVDSRYVHTLSFHHSRFARNYWFTNDLQPWDFVLEDGTPKRFETFPFEIILPNNDRQGNQDLQIALANVGRELIDELEAANEFPAESIRVVLRIYLNKAGTGPQNLPALELSIVDLQANRNQITGVARRADILNKSYPHDYYTIDRFPGLDR